jgi:hypothetical protein
MRRLARRLFNVLAVLSLLLCVTWCALWARSYFYFEEVRYGRVPLSISANSQQGRCMVRSTAQWPGLSYGLATQHKALSAADRDWGSDYFLRECSVRLGSFGYGRVGMPVGRVPSRRTLPPAVGTLTTFSIVVAPHWSLALATAVLPALSLFRWHRSRNRHRAGLCPSCDYDLRASPGRCPECGATPAATSSSA